MKKSIDAVALYAVGQGWTADPETTVILDHLRGWGEDTFGSLCDNLLRCKKIYGDSFAEIIRDKKTGTLINLKPIDPGSIKIIANRQGKIKRYEQWDKIGKEGKVVNKFQPNEILHLCNNRTADEIHGISIIQACEATILSRNEMLADRRTVMHRNVNPLKIIYVDTDVQGKMDELKVKYENQIKNKEVMIVPMDTLRVEIPTVTIVDSMPDIRYLGNFFYEAVGVPKIILGNSEEFTEASSKMAYTTFEQVYKKEQRELEADLWNQIFLRVSFNQPVSLQNELLSSEQKNTGQIGFQPNDMMLGVGK